MPQDEISLLAAAANTLSRPASLLIAALLLAAFAALGLFLLRESTGPIVVAGLCLLAAISVGIGEELIEADQRARLTTLDTTPDADGAADRRVATIAPD